MTDSQGRKFEIVTLPMPGVVGGTSTDNRNLDRLPASYANFYIANGVVLAPIFGHANDPRALEVIQRVISGSSGGGNQLRAAGVGHGHDPLRQPATAKTIISRGLTRFDNTNLTRVYSYEIVARCAESAFCRICVHPRPIFLSLPAAHSPRN